MTINPKTAIHGVLIVHHDACNRGGEERYRKWHYSNFNQTANFSWATVRLALPDTKTAKKDNLQTKPKQQSLINPAVHQALITFKKPEQTPTYPFCCEQFPNHQTA